MGRLEHAGTVTVYASGRDPEGRVFLATVDSSGAVPLSRVEGLSREEVLRIVRDAAHAAAHAATRGLGAKDLGLDDILRYRDGVYRVTGWKEDPGGEAGTVRALQSLLRRAIVPFGPAPREVWRIVRHPYADPDQFARDLSAYLEGTGELEATTLPLWTRRIWWARRDPRRAIAAAGVAVVLLGALGLGVAAWVSNARSEADLERSVAEARDDVAKILERIRTLDGERLDTLARRRDLYHSIESFELSPEERELEGRIFELSIARESSARDLAVALERLRTASGESPGATAEIEGGRLEFLVACARFEEERTLSTSTLERARATRPSERRSWPTTCPAPAGNSPPSRRPAPTTRGAPPRPR